MFYQCNKIIYFEILECNLGSIMENELSNWKTRVSDGFMSPILNWEIVGMEGKKMEKY